MEDINWIIPENKRQNFDEQYQTLVKQIPSEFLKDKDFMPYWYSEVSFPIFNRFFFEELPNNYRQEINTLYNRIIKEE